MKRDEALIWAITWMNPENTMLRECSQMQKDACWIIQFR